MTILFDATLALANILDDVRSSTSTAAGTATTLVDTARTEPVDFWNGGTLWVQSGTHANKSRRITDWALTTGTFTHDTLTTAAGSGVSYSVMDKSFPRDVLIRSINLALDEMRLAAFDTSLTTIANQEAYTLPTGVHAVKTVEIALSSAAPYHYVPWYCWREIDGEIVFDAGKQPGDAGYKIRLGYNAPHAVLDSDDDTIDARIALERLIWTAAVHAWRWSVRRTRTDDPLAVQALNEAAARAELMKRKWPLEQLKPQARLTL